jgi:GNAT superfamily N-acetyltransferase
VNGDLSYVAPRADLYAGWRPLYGAYGSSVGDPVDDAIAEAVWSWLLRGTHRLGAVLALRGERVVGFAHYRPFPRTLHGNEACYLDDLFVDAPCRGLGIAGELVRRVCEISEHSGWTEVRWVTTPQNASARRIYERIAARSDLITYRIVLVS